MTLKLSTSLRGSVDSCPRQRTSPKIQTEKFQTQETWKIRTIRKMRFVPASRYLTDVYVPRSFLPVAFFHPLFHAFFTCLAWRRHWRRNAEGMPRKGHVTSFLRYVMWKRERGKWSKDISLHVLSYTLLSYLFINTSLFISHYKHNTHLYSCFPSYFPLLRSLQQPPPLVVPPRPHSHVLHPLSLPHQYYDNSATFRKSVTPCST